MQLAYRLAAWAFVAGIALPAVAQERLPTYRAQDLVQILKPAPVEATRGLGEQTRGLTPDFGPAAPAGTTGSGVLPDLNVLFPFNSAELTPDTRRQLDELGQALVSSELSDFRFELGGHTDAVGSDAYNNDLSARRAKAVAQYLETQFGIGSSRLQAKGYGKRKLIDATEPDSPRNRRVEVVTLQ